MRFDCSNFLLLYCRFFYSTNGLWYYEQSKKKRFSQEIVLQFDHSVDCSCSHNQENKKEIAVEIYIMNNIIISKNIRIFLYVLQVYHENISLQFTVYYLYPPGVSRVGRTCTRTCRTCRTCRTTCYMNVFCIDRTTGSSS